ncbi:sugar O-acyltransferase (sialic acid O-acetyltransferase NeuD family) [Gillisia mitskevichiae]|uniref:Sugar O-acyltransferase (Sialic acid O-acetyltransferase NeuD family) n=1 Tax=Gillisia mitskevichiae TaxID=270921 RepID=A0A495PLL7_9FLAO|nr:acetyltransferase [Gillisia mitskevichiae]RKS50595.1 sugar O-acyltransferase (sialic acid O-acetyltransferase NeuD family) [Gillisia mitskevichiae]
MLNREVVLVGYSGHGFVVADAAITSNMNLRYYTDKKQITKNPFDLAYLGFEDDLDFAFWNKEYDYILGIGDNLIRRKTVDLLISKGVDLLNVIHPSASISTKVQFGNGNFISRNVSVNTLVEIGDICILNTGCIIEHECIIGNGVHIAPGAVLAGNVFIGDNTFVGANSVIKQGVRIGANVIIGAGSVILNNIADNRKIVGNPGREL